ncbi:MAG: rubrerythrin [Candidatus Aminicenantes bacterium]|nr:rubrerythrin [Candidatus Aminicenantes bacterium]
MSFEFTADEVFAVAEDIERNGAVFYREAARRTGDPAARQFLEELAAMEDDHLKTFSGMRSGLTERERGALTFDPNDESALYLGALADTRVFFKKDIGTGSLEEIYRAAVLAEKDSIAFYLGMKEVVPGRVGKARLEDIIKEEMRHIRILSEKLAASRK